MDHPCDVPSLNDRRGSLHRIVAQDLIHKISFKLGFPDSWLLSTTMIQLRNSSRGVPGRCPWRLSRSSPPGPRKPARETITRTPAAPSPRACLASPATLLRLRKSPEIHGKTWGCPRALPECDHRWDWVAVGAVSSEPVSPRFLEIARRLSDPAAWSVVGDRVDPQSCWAIPGVLGRKEVACGMDPDYVPQSWYPP